MQSVPIPILRTMFERQENVSALLFPRATGVFHNGEASKSQVLSRAQEVTQATRFFLCNTLNQPGLLLVLLKRHQASRFELIRVRI